MRNSFKSYELGATLYMPVIHQKIEDFLFGRAHAPASSIVLCLEDALSDYDVQRGVETVRSLCHAEPFSCGAKVYIRPRSLDMACMLTGLRGIHKFDGFVAPKLMPENAADWLDVAHGPGLSIMPTLESPMYFDPSQVAAVRDILTAHDRGQISAIRLGGNDLLGALALRRQRGVTSWEGPLGWVLSMMSSMFMSSGYPVAAPVFDIIDDMETLKREVERDVATGFVSKTAIHPSQVRVIEDAFRVPQHDLEQARATIDSSAKAVFQIGGVMCEPSTHRAWAERTLARDRVFGEQVPNGAL